MKKTSLFRKGKAALAAAMVPVLLSGTLLLPFARTAAPSVNALENDSYIQRLDGLTFDHMQYVDNSVMFRLPDGIGDDEEISVIVTVDSATVMDAYENSDKTMSIGEFAQKSDEARFVRQSVFNERAKMLSKLESVKVDYTVGEIYDTVLCGFEIIISAGDFEKAGRALGDGKNLIVGETYNTCETELVENEVNVFDTGIFDSSDAGYDGSGIVVAVLDTGLDSNHTAFSPNNFTSDHLGLTYDEVAGLIGETAAYELAGGLTVDDVYVNDKVPFGYDYADNDPDVYSTHNNHGTHVSGVIVGNDDVIRGVAPNAQLVSMKIFSDVMDTARTAWILAALEDCVVLDVDVINMSIGTACGFSRETDEEKINGIYDRIRSSGISMVVAASNSYSSAYGSEANGNLGLTSNPDTGTVGSPSTYEGVLSIASISGVETPYIKYGQSIVYFVEATNSAGEEKSFFDTLLGDSDSAQLEYIVIPGVGRTADYTGVDVNGKIALVRRGSNTFEEKALIAKQQGAAGIIIYNNVSGDIKMNVGDADLAVCSISQNDGEMLAKGDGKITIARSQTSGPFISDFSSWGPTPDLRIKPEITGHGGSILSSVTGGGYDRLSGTSMACPNMSGVVVLLRQYVVENFPEIANDSVKVNAMVNSLLMSTADVALNKNGLPYSVRKQGAGLANLLDAVNTPAYITTFDKNGNPMDKSKLELGDDPERAGVYEMSFNLNNFGDESLTYTVGAYVMTEGVSETKTNAGETTVTEEAYILNGATVDVSVSDGSIKKGRVTVEAGKTAYVTVKITLSDADKEYLDNSFENGMYVEGYITLTAESGTDIDLSVPYLAFYGDWTAAPLFDLTYYDTNADELDDGLDVEDKTMADAYPTRPVGGVSDDYVSYLGSYYFLQDPDDMVIAANENFVALSNQVGTIHSLRFVWAGMLRNAAKIDITITNETTGEVIFERTETDVRKSYSDGGASIYPSNVEIEFDAADTASYNLANNSKYVVKLVGYLDYGDGGLTTNANNVFEFPLTIDFQAPTVTGVEYYYKYDKTLDKNRLYADVLVYDNHYTMSSQIGYVGNGTDENDNPAPQLFAFEQYMTPVFSEENSTTRVTYELTDYLYDIKNNSINRNSFVVSVYDYALNYATYEIELPDNFTEFYFESLEDGLTLSPNEVYTLEPVVYPYTEWSELLDYASSKPSVARVVNNKLVAVAPGVAIIKAQDPATNESVTFNVTVLDENDEGYVKYDRPVVDIFSLDGYETIKAYYILDNEEKDIGDTGNIRFFEGDYRLSMYPSERVLLNYSLDAYFPQKTTVSFESSNENIVTIDNYGNVTAVAEGFASVTVKVLLDGQSTYYSETVSVEVKDPYVNTGSILTHYYGLGGLVDIPTRLSLTEIGQFAFSNFEYIMKTPEELAFDDAETSKAWFIGDNTITKVIIPEGVKKINNYAFANLTALEEVVLPSTLESIEYGAFFNCTSLSKITFSGENNLKIISQNAFENCALSGTLELDSICVISDYAFAGNQKLQGIVLADSLLSVGQYAFASCKKLENVEIKSDKVKYGGYAFYDCESLTDFTVNSAVLPEGMFYECASLSSITIGADVKDIGAYAFRSTKIGEFKLDPSNASYKVVDGNKIFSSDMSTLVAIAPTLTGEFVDNSVKYVGKGAFSHNTKLSSVVMNNVGRVEDYGFAESEGLASISLGSLSHIGEYAFFGTAISERPEITKDTFVGRYAFGLTNLVNVVIPDGATVNEGTYSELTQLESVVIGDNVIIGDYAFSLNKDIAYQVEEINEYGQKMFRYVFRSPLKSLVIGNDVTIGEAAFMNAANLEEITLGANAILGDQAFYNTSSLKTIDLSLVKSVGDYALSGDVYYACLDENMSVAAVSPEGRYVYTYHGPLVESLDVSSAESIGEYAFSYCRELKEVKLSDALTEIPAYAFAGDIALKGINLENVITVGEYAFMESGLETVNLMSASTIDKYAFVYNEGLINLTLSEEGSDLGEAAFAYCGALESVTNLNYSKSIGHYAFAYTAVTSADLSNAVSVGDNAFIKEEITPFTVVLGESLTSIGDNPFAFCDVAPFESVATEEINGHEIEVPTDDYPISDTVSVIDGSLYCKTVNGYELITYTGDGSEEFVLAEDTVRITSYAFAGSDIKRVKMPYTTTSIGHKAFCDCDSLEIVIFGSYTVPVFEEEFDPAYYESLEHVPGSGDYGSYIDYDGTEVVIEPMGLLPFFIWNATGGMYSNVFYGASFVDYVGYVENKLIMVSPVNGVGYDSFICDQYFDYRIEGPAAPDDITVDAINAIKRIPERVTYEDKATVEAARAAYDKIATYEQMSLVSNYSSLVSAEQRIAALAPIEDDTAEAPAKDNMGAIIAILLVVMAAFVGFVVIRNRNEAKSDANG
ncbi:MAG: leucine-rich repeat protein [Clostridia bacterium]|nr:leucine-rich repeat protein [Clostridia bacterium]